jgi:hypothetical protein
MDRQRLLKRLDQAWREFTDSFAGLSEAQLLAPGPDGGWSIRDSIAHVTTWEEEALKSLPSILAGNKQPRYSVLYGGIDAFNARMAEHKSRLSLAAVLRQMEVSHRHIVELVAHVPEDQLTRETRFRRRLRLDTYSHYPIHARVIREQLSR